MLTIDVLTQAGGSQSMARDLGPLRDLNNDGNDILRMGGKVMR